MRCGWRSCAAISVRAPPTTRRCRGAITAALASADAADDDMALAIALHFDALTRIVIDPTDAAARLDRVRGIAESIGDRRLIHLADAFAALATVAGGDVDDGALRGR